MCIINLVYLKSDIKSDNNSILRREDDCYYNTEHWLQYLGNTRRQLSDIKDHHLHHCSKVGLLTSKIFSLMFLKRSIHSSLRKELSKGTPRTAFPYLIENIF